VVILVKEASRDNGLQQLVLCGQH